MPSLRFAIDQSYNQPDIAKSLDFPPHLGGVPEIILTVSKQEWYNCAGLQEQKL